MEHNAVANSQYSRRATIELHHVLADIAEDVLEENICKALSLTELNVIPNDLHACHWTSKLDSIIVKFKYCKEKNSIM